MHSHFKTPGNREEQVERKYERLVRLGPQLPRFGYNYKGVMRDGSVKRYLYDLLPYPGRSMKPSWYFITAKPMAYPMIHGTLNKYVYYRQLSVSTARIYNGDALS